MGDKLQTIGDSKRYLTYELQDIYPQPEAGAVAAFLIESVTGLSPTEQLKRATQPLSNSERDSIICGYNELKSHKPVQHITGYGWFFDRKFRVNGDVLIPRQETEELVQMAINQAGTNFGGVIIDFCTGSGCIAITLSATFPSATVRATDSSERALHIASLNNTNHMTKVKLIRHNLLTDSFNNLPEADMIVSNPPYVRESEKSLMEPGVLQFEPHEALFVSDNNPLLFYGRLLIALTELLKPGGWFCFEINEALGNEVFNLFTKSFLTNIQIINDINSKNRFICGTRPGCI